MSISSDNRINAYSLHAKNCLKKENAAICHGVIHAHINSYAQRDHMIHSQSSHNDVVSDSKQTYFGLRSLTASWNLLFVMRSTAVCIIIRPLSKSTLGPGLRGVVKPHPHYHRDLCKTFVLFLYLSLPEVEGPSSRFSNCISSVMYSNVVCG